MDAGNITRREDSVEILHETGSLVSIVPQDSQPNKDLVRHIDQGTISHTRSSRGFCGPGISKPSHATDRCTIARKGGAIVSVAEARLNDVARSGALCRQSNSITLTRVSG